MGYMEAPTSSTSRVWIVAALAVGGFLALAYGLAAVGPALGVESPASRQVLVKLLMIVVSLAVWAFTGRPWSEMGFRRGRRVPRGWAWLLLACGSMVFASAGMILSDARHPLLRGMPFLLIVLTVWILSSVAEEIYVRGLVQSLMQGRPSGESASDRVPRAVVLASAAAFAAMHVPLMWSGAGPLGGGIIVVATFGVGLACAALRALSGSLTWPIAVHIAANAASPIGGIIGVVIYRILHGHLPALGG